MNFLCKIFRFVLDLLGNVVSFVAEAVTIIGEAVVDVLTDLIVAASEGIGSIFASNPLLWGILLAGGLYFLLGDDEDNKDGLQTRDLRLARDLAKEQVRNG